MRWIPVVLACAALSACAGSPVALSKMSADELKSVTDAQLCRAKKNTIYSNKLIVAEAERRGNPCEVEAAEKPASPKPAKVRAPLAGAPPSDDEKNRIIDILVKCEPTRLMGLRQKGTPTYLACADAVGNWEYRYGLKTNSSSRMVLPVSLLGITAGNYDISGRNEHLEEFVEAHREVEEALRQ